MDDYYKVLEIKPGSSNDEIKRAYRKLSLQHHPDKNGGSQEATEKFQEIKRAYEALTEEKNENNGVNFARPPFAGPGFSVHGFTGSGFSDFNVPDGMKAYNFTEDIDEIMRMFTSGGIPSFVKNPKMQKPVPIIKNLTITMSQALSGCSIPIEIQRWILDGNVKKEEIETLYVKIPPGIDNKEILICRGKGNIINSDNVGDVKVFININNETNFERRGLDLIYKYEISLKEALCGFSFDLKHISGKSYRINNNRGNVVALSSKKTIGGLGFTRDGHTGSLIIEFSVKMPNKLTEEQILAIEKIL